MTTNNLKRYYFKQWSLYGEKKSSLVRWIVSAGRGGHNEIINTGVGEVTSASLKGMSGSWGSTLQAEEGLGSAVIDSVPGV